MLGESIRFRRDALLRAAFRDQHAVIQSTQVALKGQFREMLLRGEPLPSFRDVGFKNYSQFEEDGILLFIFSAVGTTSRRVVEISAADGRECMATNLLVNHGWDGLLIDGDAKKVQTGRRLFSSNARTWIDPPRFIDRWITAENVNDVVLSQGFSDTVDLLSLDVDGMDYWLWQALTCISPRVCVIETNNSIPSGLSLSAPYRSDFGFDRTRDASPVVTGASLRAMTELAGKKGYRLIGTHRYGFNAFFARDDVGRDHFPAVSVESCHQDPFTKRLQASWWPKVENAGWMPV